jgi:hypothetical protein
MMLGGIVSGLDRRYRIPKEAREPAADAAAAGQSA